MFKAQLVLVVVNCYNRLVHVCSILIWITEVFNSRGLNRANQWVFDVFQAWVFLDIPAILITDSSNKLRQSCSISVFMRDHICPLLPSDRISIQSIDAVCG